VRRVVLVGCGRHAQRAHLPVLARLGDRVALVAVVDLPGEEPAVRRRVAAAGVDARALEFVGASLGADPGPFALPSCDGVIVSSPALTHRTYIDAALSAAGVALLVDKPLTARTNVRGDPGQARALVGDFTDLSRQAGGRLVMVGTQRRYHPLYRRIGQHLHSVHAQTGQGVTFVQSLTNDGLWNDAYLDGSFYDPATTGGGKLINTGYHLLDTIPWLLRHCQSEAASDVRRIRGADVYAQFFGPEDAIALAPNAGRRVAGAGNEINACLQVAFRDEDERTVCLWQLGALHEGISARRTTRLRDDDDPTDAGRTKQDVLTMYQGPVAAVWMRRIAKLVPGDGAQVGESGHAELLCAQNAHVTGADGALEQVVGPYIDCDAAPTEEFLAVLCGDRPALDVAAPLAEQAIAVGILAAAYESAATRRSVRVPFDGCEWKLPPAAAAYLDGGAGA
jgi:predicted dehydrogenase